MESGCVKNRMRMRKNTQFAETCAEQSESHNSEKRTHAMNGSEQLQNAAREVSNNHLPEKFEKHLTYRFCEGIKQSTKQFVHILTTPRTRSGDGCRGSR